MYRGMSVLTGETAAGRLFVSVRQPLCTIRTTHPIIRNQGSFWRHGRSYDRRRDHNVVVRRALVGVHISEIPEASRNMDDGRRRIVLRVVSR